MTTTTTTAWSIGQVVQVQPRTWAGINRPGGIGRVTKIHLDEHGAATSLDVKYTVASGNDTRLNLSLIIAYEDLNRGSRKRRTATLDSATAEKENDAAVVSAMIERNRLFKKMRKKAKKRQSATKKASITKHDKSVKKKSSRKDAVDVPETITFEQLAANDASHNTTALSLISPLPTDGPESQTKRVYMLSHTQRGDAKKKKLIEPLLPSGMSPDDTEQSYAYPSLSNAPNFPKPTAATTSSPPTTTVPAVTIKKKKARPIISQPSAASSNIMIKTKKKQSRTATTVQRAAAFSKSLQSVYNDQLEDATRFVQQVTNRQPPEAAAVPPPPVNPEKKARQEQFATSLMIYLQTMEMADRADVLQEIQGFSNNSDSANLKLLKACTSAEADEFVDTLVKENKIMESDGQLYLI